MGIRGWIEAGFAIGAVLTGVPPIPVLIVAAVRLLLRWITAAIEKKKREEEEAWRRREEEGRVSRQPFMVFCVLNCNNGDKATRSHLGQNNEETQRTGTRTRHRSTSRQDCEDEAAGGAPGGGVGRSDGENGDSDQEKSEDEESHQENRENRGGPTVIVNLWSLYNKMLMILKLIQETFEFIGLTETFLNQIINWLLSRVSGPNFSHQFRNRQVPEGQRRRRRSGGMAMLFSTDLLGEPLQFGPTTTFEYDARLVQRVDWIQSIVFICLYRRPGQTRRVMVQFLLELEELLDQARLVSQSITVTGDFNIWVDQETRASNMFQSFLTRNHLQQHVNQPTHRSGHTLDLVLTRNIQISDVSVGEKKISNHYPVFFKARPRQSSEEED